MSVEVYFLKVFSNKYEDDEINAQTNTLIFKKKSNSFQFQTLFYFILLSLLAFKVTQAKPY